MELGRDGRAVRLPWKAWEEEPGGRAFRFPEGWSVRRLEMVGWPDAREPDLEVLAAAVERQARGSRDVSIAVEDLTRPGRLAAILEAVVSGLLAAGVREVDIVVAVGAHGPPAVEGLQKKVGDEILRNFDIRVHDPSGDLADTGLKVGNRPLLIDARFLAAQFRLGIGSVVPNPFAGFSGGGKIILPGLASMEVLEWLHKLAMMGFAGGVARLEGNRVRVEADRVADRLPLHMSVCCLVDGERTVREIHAGPPAEAHPRACQRARQVYRSQLSGSFDLLFCNAYPKDAEFLQVETAYTPLRTGALDHLADGGSVVLMAACHRGRGHHGLFDAGCPLHREPLAAKPYLGGATSHVFAPGITEGDCRVTHWDGYPFFAEWEELLEALVRLHGSTARAGVFPIAPLQLGPAA